MVIDGFPQALTSTEALTSRSADACGLTTAVSGGASLREAGPTRCRALLTGRDPLWNVRQSTDRLPPASNSEKALSKSASRARLAEIIRKRSFGRGEITLASGRKSDFYFNLKPTMLDPEGAALLAELTYEALRDDRLDYVGGLEMGAVPLAGAIAQLSWLKGHPIAAFFVRKKPKEHGARLAVEGLARGESLAGKRIVIVEDVTTTGGSALKAAEAVREAGGEIVLVFTMIDRDEGASETFAEAGIAFRSLYKAGEFLKD
jgi:orotate phosphoribosyltransferase